MKRIAALCALCVSSFAAGRAAGDGVIKIGVIAELSGPFADVGKKIDEGIKLYLRQHGDVAGGKKVQVILRNVTGPEAKKPMIIMNAATSIITSKSPYVARF